MDTIKTRPAGFVRIFDNVKDSRLEVVEIAPDGSSVSRLVEMDEILDNSTNDSGIVTWVYDAAVKHTLQVSLCIIICILLFFLLYIMVRSLRECFRSFVETYGTKTFTIRQGDKEKKLH